VSSARRVPRDTSTDEDRRIAKISDELVERGHWPLLRRIAELHHVLIPELLGASKLKGVVAARHAFWKALHDEQGLSWTQIGKLFGKRHDAVIQAGDKGATRARRRAEDRVSSLIADFVTGEGRPDLGQRIRAGEWRPAAGSLAAQGEARASSSRKASPIE
jgi:hypothetical protein